MDANDFTTGLNTLLTEDEPTLIVLTEACALTTTAYYNLCKLALAQCAKVKNRFCILDIPPVTADGKTDISGFRTGVGSNNLQYGAVYYPYLKTSISFSIEDADVTIEGIKSGNTTSDTDLKTIKSEYTGVYADIKNALTGPNYNVILPASAAVAGVYAAVDNARGVWKAPANVSLNSVTEPAIKITADDQNKLNVDAVAGKSVNAIRSFTGKGILVWGARTLAGNDNEWRYVSVRRLFNLIEDSTSKASAFAVFEPNDATTWLKVQSMIDSYLYSLWQQGALAGSTAKQAYFVKVGLGSTMTTQDILEGRMIVEIGVAAVRPAEFIILKFSHKLQEA